MPTTEQRKPDSEPAPGHAASQDASLQHVQVHVTGTVQGVGFRPFVFRLACQHGLAGAVHNNTQGVFVHAQGAEERVRAFVRALREQAPPAARIDALRVTPLPLASFGEFRILPSEVQGDTFTQVPADLALCADCRREMEDARDRRFRYPFTNCTACGPRFTIIRALPYDRPLTTMQPFAMCDACRAEYVNPADRRFHAQPVACPQCGPTLRLLRWTGEAWRDTARDNDALAEVSVAIQSGGIALVQGLGGFHLACDAYDDSVVRELRRRKRRDERPFALMFPSEAALRESCDVSAEEWEALASPRAPIVLLRRRASSTIAASVAPGNPLLGAMLPYTPLHVLLLDRCGRALVMTSANLSDEPICYEVEDALARMAGIADVALVHDRAIHMFADDSVVRVAGGVPRVWRRSRGYVPQPIHVARPFRRQTLAFGPQLKSTFCLGKRNLALLSQHLGDMDGELAVEAHRRALRHYLRLFDARIELAACDLHPDYATTRLAETWCEKHEVPLVRVQHHHAHLAACLAENGASEQAIGLCLDGTGFGTDGTIWGGEVLIGDARAFTRAAHLQVVPMLGGKHAAREPWRMAVAWLHAAFGDEMPALSLPLLDRIRKDLGEDALQTLLSPGLHARVFPRTSSMGRLFDAVAALTFFGTRSQHEGQAAMLLEGKMSAAPEEPYPLEIVQHGEAWILSPIPMFRALVADLRRRVPAASISRRFHEGIVGVLARVCGILRDSAGLHTVALSGGCFQNAFLLTELVRDLESKGFRVLTHRDVPAGDGGVALGQAVVASMQTE